MSYKYKCETCNEGFEKLRRRGSETECRSCGNARRLREWKVANREYVNAKERERVRLAKLAGTHPRSTWQERNKEKAAAKARRWREANPERWKEIEVKYRANNRETLLTKYRTRRHHKRRPWGFENLAPFYESARRVTQCLGIPHEVDHIVPLQGETVSGLHVPENLRVIPRSLNRSKCNRMVYGH